MAGSDLFLVWKGIVLPTLLSRCLEPTYRFWTTRKSCLRFSSARCLDILDFDLEHYLVKLWLLSIVATHGPGSTFIQIRV